MLFLLDAHYFIAPNLHVVVILTNLSPVCHKFTHFYSQFTLPEIAVVNKSVRRSRKREEEGGYSVHVASRELRLTQSIL